MNEKDNSTIIPFFAFESVLDRNALTIKRLWIMCILLIVLLVSTNALWIWYESQFIYETTTIEAEQDGEGVNIVGTGDINYGTESKSN